MQNLIVLHYTDGTIVKGSTGDFFPNKNWFHLKEQDSGKTRKVDVTTLKGVFFVKDFEGNPNYKERDDIERTGLGKKIQVRFKDGETLIGYTTGFSPTRTGFILFPSDPHSNTQKIFVLNEATKEILFV